MAVKSRVESAQAFHPSRDALLGIYCDLNNAYGDLGWWPGDSPFEVMVGAVLTQNTAWTNVEKALAQLRAADALSLPGILALPQAELALLIRSSGYFNIKANRLRQLCLFLRAAGGEAALAQRDTIDLRNAMLTVNGVGPETCDDILLYAFDRPVFVIDAYTRRLLKRYGLARGDEAYEALRAGFEVALGSDVALYQAYHGLIVEHAKAACAVKPRCSACCLAMDCRQL